MKQKLIFTFSLVLLIIIFSLPTFGADNRYKIAVLPFDDGLIKGSDRWWNENWELGKGVSDELVTALLETKKFRLIEREQIDKVLHEQNFGARGRVDDKTAAKIGKILGVQYLVLGRVTEFSLNSQGGALGLGEQGLGLRIKNTTARVVIDARLVNTSTAEIIASVSGKGEKSSTNLALTVNWNVIAFGSNEFRKTNLGIALRDAANQVADGLAANAYPDGTGVVSTTLTGMVFYAKNNTVIIDIGLNENVQNGMVFVVEHVIDVVKDPDTGEEVDQIIEPVAEITVTEVKEKTATCIITKKFNYQYSIAAKDIVKQK